MIDGEALRTWATQPPPRDGLEWRAPDEPRSFSPAGSEPGRRSPPLVIGGPLGALGIAAFICDGLGEVRAVTPPAAAALAAGRVRVLNGRLAAPRHYECADMERAIAVAASRSSLTAEAETVVNRSLREPSEVQVLDVITLPRAPEEDGFEPRALVVLRGGELGWSGLEPVLTRAYGLTAAEAQVAARMALGASREQIAVERRASLQTVRSQIKSIFQKLSVTRERELVSLLARIVQR